MITTGCTILRCQYVDSYAGYEANTNRQYKNIRLAPMISVDDICLLVFLLITQVTGC